MLRNNVYNSSHTQNCEKTSPQTIERLRRTCYKSKEGRLRPLMCCALLRRCLELAPHFNCRSPRVGLSICRRVASSATGGGPIIRGATHRHHTIRRFWPARRVDSMCWRWWVCVTLRALRRLHSHARPDTIWCVRQKPRPDDHAAPAAHCTRRTDCQPACDCDGAWIVGGWRGSHDSCAFKRVPYRAICASALASPVHWHSRFGGEEVCGVATCEQARPHLPLY